MAVLRAVPAELLGVVAAVVVAFWLVPSAAPAGGVLALLICPGVLLTSVLRRARAEARQRD